MVNSFIRNIIPKQLTNNKDAKIMMPKIDDEVFKCLVNKFGNENSFSGLELNKILSDKIIELSERLSRIEKKMDEINDE